MRPVQLNPGGIPVYIPPQMAHRVEIPPGAHLGGLILQRASTSRAARRRRAREAAAAALVAVLAGLLLWGGWCAVPALHEQASTHAH